MNTTNKHLIHKSICLLLSFVFIVFSLTGCSTTREKMYSNYIKSLMGINYIGANADYIKASGASKEDADALYEANADMLATNIEQYYGVTITDAPEMHDEYIELAKHIYSKVNYSIEKVYKGTDSYYVDIKVYPMDIFNQTNDDVSAYVDSFNTAVANGDYNEYTLNEYETIFSRGLIDILFEASLEMQYADPVTITVQIVEDGKTYKINDSDFLSIDKALFNPAN